MEREANEQRKRRREGPEFAAFLRGVGSRIYFLREKVGLTQQEASARAGLDIRLWQRLEAGEANSTLLVFHDVARVLGVEVHQVTRPYAGKPVARRGPGRPPKRRS